VGSPRPIFSKYCTPAEHIVRARGKRTKYTSVSLDPDKIDDFGPALYQALCPDIMAKGHAIIARDALLHELRVAASAGEMIETLGHSRLSLTQSADEKA
jgi:hypothetical protein